MFKSSQLRRVLLYIQISSTSLACVYYAYQIGHMFKLW
jgi:hypothetical protein